MAGGKGFPRHVFMLAAACRKALAETAPVLYQAPSLLALSPNTRSCNDDVESMQNTSGLALLLLSQSIAPQNMASGKSQNLEVPRGVEADHHLKIRRALERA